MTFVSEALQTRFVLLGDEGKAPHQAPLCRLHVDVGTRAAVVEAHRRVEAAGWPIHKPARTT